MGWDGIAAVAVAKDTSRTEMNLAKAASESISPVHVLTIPSSSYMHRSRLIVEATRRLSFMRAVIEKSTFSKLI